VPARLEQEARKLERDRLRKMDGKWDVGRLKRIGRKKDREKGT
jgi:hypothetical protein